MGAAFLGEFAEGTLLLFLDIVIVRPGVRIPVDGAILEPFRDLFDRKHFEARCGKFNLNEGHCC
jgi:hypothetical protein